MSVRVVCGTRAVWPGGGVVRVRRLGAAAGAGADHHGEELLAAGAVLVVAVRAAAVPVATAPPESASRELTLPLPVAAGLARVVLVAGLVQVWVTEDFSLQELTSQELAWPTATVGETWLAVVVVPGVCAEAVTDAAPPLLR